jgi:hypothetical protein
LNRLALRLCSSSGFLQLRGERLEFRCVFPAQLVQVDPGSGGHWRCSTVPTPNCSVVDAERAGEVALPLAAVERLPYGFEI